MRVVLSHLDDVNLKISISSGEAVGILDRIEKLLTSSPIIEASEAVRLRAAQRAVEKKAPFHHDKNAMADAIIIETYADCVRDMAASGVRFAFVTHTRATSASSTAIKICHIWTSPPSSRVSNRCTSSTCPRRSAALSLRSSPISCL